MQRRALVALGDIHGFIELCTCNGEMTDDDILTLVRMFIEYEDFVREGLVQADEDL